eukprot:1158402-Pelagomonas_calceolata.AAC.20
MEAFLDDDAFDDNLFDFLGPPPPQAQPAPALPYGAQQPMFFQAQQQQQQQQQQQPGFPAVPPPACSLQVPNDLAPADGGCHLQQQHHHSGRENNPALGLRVLLVDDDAVVGCHIYFLPDTSL